MSRPSKRSSAWPRGGMTLVETLLAVALFLTFFLMVWSVFRGGNRALARNQRKLDGTQATHVRFEALRHRLEAAEWAFTPGREPQGNQPGVGGCNTLVTNQGDAHFESGEGQFRVGDQTSSHRYGDIRFWSQDRFRIKFLVQSAKPPGQPIGSNPAVERSTLVSKAFLEAQAEEVLERHHVWEEAHGWCVNGASIHYGFTE